MVTFFKLEGKEYVAVVSSVHLTKDVVDKLNWLFGNAKPTGKRELAGRFVGPRAEMITPWSTNAVEMACNMGISGIERIELFTRVQADKAAEYDPMTQHLYDGLNEKALENPGNPAEICHVTDLEAYNVAEGLALSAEEIDYLKQLSARLGRPLTDSEVFGFSQVNSEHCRHKIFNGKFIIDGEEKPETLFSLIKKTSRENPNGLVSAYKDNVAFVKGPVVKQFAPEDPTSPSRFVEKDVETVISLKAETHNFPTTVEPFNGAATGTGGEIRDRLAGGRASVPIAGTAVYMTSYPRMQQQGRPAIPLSRPWLYQTPEQILIKASNGASDFGNKFGQPLVCGSVLTYEHEEDNRTLAYDKVIMLAGGVGYGLMRDAIKDTPEPSMKVVVMGGDNYRIGMGGGAVSSVETGQYENKIELNAVQRSNPEMQKRVSNVIRALSEMEDNPCVSIHDHGAGGHLNALSELVEKTGGHIDMSKLPVGDPSLSAKEIIGNESQERMGLVLKEEHLDFVKRIADRERAPFYVVGETTGDNRFVFEQADGTKPIDLEMKDMFGSSPRTVMKDNTVTHSYADAPYNKDNIEEYLRKMLRLEAVASKDWLTNKVDRSVTGRVARQQCCGPLQLPLSDCAVVALDYHGRDGIATSLGHAPQAALIDPAAGSVLSIAEALTNICAARLTDGLKSVSLSANWMWPCKNPGEDAALYRAVKACSDFACGLGINIPTGKDSLSMTQKYGEHKVLAPGTVIISAAGQVSDVRKVLTPVVSPMQSSLIYVDFSGTPLQLGGSAFEQALGYVGAKAPSVISAEYFAAAFNAVQTLQDENLVIAQHDVSAGGLITTLLEMCFANVAGSMQITLDQLVEPDPVKAMFAENPAIVLQTEHPAKVLEHLHNAGVKACDIGYMCDVAALESDRVLSLSCGSFSHVFGIEELRDVWYESSYELDKLQTDLVCADARRKNFCRQPIKIDFAQSGFKGTFDSLGINPNRTKSTGVVAAILREKGVNGDREMAYSLHLAGFDVKDVHMTDLVAGREDLKDVNLLVFCGGFSNSDVLGSAKGWAGSLLYNDKARKTLQRYFARPDTLSLGVCNGCQLMVELGLLSQGDKLKMKMEHNRSGKFESNFVTVKIPANNSVMLSSLAGIYMGVWVAHAEGRFDLPYSIKEYNGAMKYAYREYPGNPNGSRGALAAICSKDGRHLAMMPHIERTIFPWQCAYWPSRYKDFEATPWLEAFVNARRWVERKKGM